MRLQHVRAVSALPHCSCGRNHTGMQQPSLHALPMVVLSQADFDRPRDARCCLL